MEVQAVPGHRDYLSVIFRRCVMALVGASVPEDTGFDRDSLEHIVDLAEQYFTDMTAHLSRISHMQRRTKPSMADLALLLHFKQLNVLSLMAEAERTPSIEESKPMATLNALYFDPEEADLDPKEAPFFERPTRLAQSVRKTPACIPSWMPALPAEHTYRHTPSHSSRIRDLRTVRMSLVEEGRLAERALQRLLGDRGSSSIIELPKPGERPATSSMVLLGSDEREAQVREEKAEAAAKTEADAAADVKPEVSAQAQPSSQPDARPDAQSDAQLDAQAFMDTEDASGSQLGAPRADSEAAHADSQADSRPPSTSNEPLTPETSAEPKEPLRIQLHVSREPTPQPAKKLSLKLSLGKNRKQRKEPLVGKRPRVDIAVLAQQQKQGERQGQAGKQRSEASEEPKQPKQDEDRHNTHSTNAILAAALASYSH